MVTIKDLAKFLDISPSTVSIVMRGNGDARKISKATQERILEAAKKLGYTPNVQAKLLRSTVEKNSIITLFWASDLRPYALTRFLSSLQNSLIQYNYPLEIIVKPYQASMLANVMTESVLLGTNGAIICNTTEEDMLYLESTSFRIPIVLYNRYSDKYPAINMDDTRIGELPAKVFISHGKKKPALLYSKASFNGMNIRTNVFLYELYNSDIKDTVIFQVPDTCEGGYSGGVYLSELEPLPDCLLCTSDSIAYGALKAFHDYGVAVPDDIEIISVGNGSVDTEIYSVPSLSVINLPMEKMADACLQRLYRSMTKMDDTVDSISFPVSYIARESCPE